MIMTLVSFNIINSSEVSYALRPAPPPPIKRKITEILDLSDSDEQWESTDNRDKQTPRQTCLWAIDDTTCLLT